MLLLLHKLTTFSSPLIIYRVQALDQNDEEVVLSDDNHVYVLSSKHFSSPNCISRSISSSIDDWRKAVAASFLDLHIGSVWIRIILHLCFPLFLFFFFFFSATRVSRDKVTVHALFTYCSRDPPPLYSEKNIKNRSHSTIHPFKNYFTTVFSVFSF